MYDEGRPLRAKDLVPVDLVREPIDAGSNAGASQSSGFSTTTRFICPVSRYCRSIDFYTDINDS